MPITIFFCYAREDEALLNKLKAHLKPLQRQNLIDVWYDRDISAGTEWELEISEHLNTAQIILLLVSPDFMNSEYCYGTEMKRAVERHERKDARVIPVILDYVYWQVDPLNKLQALPTDGVPVMSARWHSLNRALFNVTKGIYEVVEQLTEKPVSVSSIVSEEAQPKETQASTHVPVVQPVRNVLPLVAPVPIEKLAVLRTLTGHAHAVSSVTISADGQQLFSGSADKTIKVWDLPTGKAMRTLTGHTYAVSSIAISADGRTLVSGSVDKTIKVWDLSTGKEMRTLTGHSEAVCSVAISADGQQLFSGSADDMIKVWDLPTGKEMRTLTGHSEVVSSVAISADGRTLVSGSWDFTIKVWDLFTGEEMRTLTGHVGSVSSVAISADGRTLVSGSDRYDPTIKVWDLPTGKEMRTLTGHVGSVSSVAISADGQTLVSGSYDKTIKVWGV